MSNNVKFILLTIWTIIFDLIALFSVIYLIVTASKWYWIVLTILITAAVLYGFNWAVISEIKRRRSSNLMDSK